MKKYTLYFLAGLILASCSTSSDVETPSGISINFIKRGEEKDRLISTYVVAMSADYRTDDGKELIKTDPDNPLYIQFDTSYTIEQGGFIQEVIETLRVGDSAYFELPARNLWEKSFRRTLPDSIDAESKVRVNLGVIAQMTLPEYRDYMTQLERKKNETAYNIELEGLKKYIADNNLVVETTASGLRYQITQTTSGPAPQEGQMVSVRYRGTLLDGTLFDEGVYSFPLGKGQVIAGWDEGIGYLKLGEKGMLYVPSELGYGSRGSGANIPPFSSLVFEVELIEIK